MIDPNDVLKITGPRFRQSKSWRGRVIRNTDEDRYQVCPVYEILGISTISRRAIQSTIKQLIPRPSAP